MKTKKKRVIPPHEPQQPIVDVEQLQEECDTALCVWQRLKADKATQIKSRPAPPPARPSRRPISASV
jgi:hypothetical protein